MHFYETMEPFRWRVRYLFIFPPPQSSYQKQCSGVIRIKDFTYEKLGKGIVLNGKCSTCGGDVTRVVEGD